MPVIAAPDHYADLVAKADGVTFLRAPSDTKMPLQAAHVFLRDKHTIAEVARTTLCDAILSLGRVDVMVCAMDADWSGLKFLKRKEKPV